DALPISRLANGRQARMEETEALARAPYIVVAEMTGSAAGGFVRAAASIGRDTIEELFAARIESTTEIAFDAKARAVRARRQRRFGAVRLEDGPAQIEDLDAAAKML